MLGKIFGFEKTFVQKLVLCQCSIGHGQTLVWTPAKPKGLDSKLKFGLLPNLKVWTPNSSLDACLVCSILRHLIN
ncbi:MAG: hypothetical protein DRR08_18490 [Candidatus Parabeggiatoa sp. nov. 2]|nr:MAG: hypothetical protein B6247_04925 [Beggiatoa sp. 4572_84]RKZ57625.1 MAG: hypothetical protein DRR08_18490 [Gammaproteobacteria bacterium]